MTAAEVDSLVATRALRRISPDPETARSELVVARRHVDSAAVLIDSDPTLAFVALYDAMRKAVTAHMRSRGYRVTTGPGAHVKTGRYAAAALDHLGIDDHLGEFDSLRDMRNQSEYDAMWVTAEQVRLAITHVSAIVEAVAADLP